MAHRTNHARSFTFTLLLALALLSGCEQHEDLVAAPSQKQAMQILVALAERGVTDATQEQAARDRQTVWIIRVPRASMLDAQRVLIENDLPYEEHGGFETMLSQGGIIPTKSDERARLMHAIGEELARTFEAYDRVTHARVHIMIPEKPIGRQRPGEDGPRASAMVLIKYVSDESSTAIAAAAPDAAPADAPVTMEQVRQMVAGSVEDLDPEGVTVAYTRARRYASPALPTTTASASTSDAIAESESDAAATAVSGPGSSMLMQLLLATGAFALLSLVLLWMLVRSRRQLSDPSDPAPTRPEWTTDPSNRSIYDPSQAVSARSAASARSVASGLSR